MPLISANLSLERAMNLVSSRFSGVTLDDVIIPKEGSQRTKKTPTPVRMYRIREKAKIMEAAFHRFLLFAEGGNESFRDVHFQRRQNFPIVTFLAQSTTGATCLLLNPRHRDEKFLQDSDNPLLTTAEPVVPIFLQECSALLPKYSLKMADFQHFCFKTVTLQVISVCTVS